VTSPHAWSGATLIALLCACSSSAPTAGAPASEVASLPAQLTFEPGDVPPVLDGFYSTDVSLEGYWFRETEPIYANSLLKIQSSGEGRYSVEFLHVTDSGAHKRVFDASWGQGALRAERPIEFPKALFPVRIRGADGFVAEENLGQIELPGTEDEDWSTTFVFWRWDAEGWKRYEKAWQFWGGLVEQ